MPGAQRLCRAGHRLRRLDQPGAAGHARPPAARDLPQARARLRGAVTAGGPGAGPVPEEYRAGPGSSWRGMTARSPIRKGVGHFSASAQLTERKAQEVTAPPRSARTTRRRALDARSGRGDRGRALTKRYPGSVTALDALTVTVAPGHHRPGRRQRRRQVHAHQDPARPARRRPPAGPRCWASTAPRDGARIRTLTGYMPEHDCLPPDVPGHRVRHPHGPDVRPAARPRPRSGPPNRCATSACTRSATGRSAPTRPA